MTAPPPRLSGVGRRGSTRQHVSTPLMCTAWPLCEQQQCQGASGQGSEVCKQIGLETVVGISQRQPSAMLVTAHWQAPARLIGRHLPGYCTPCHVILLGPLPGDVRQELPSLVGFHLGGNARLMLWTCILGWCTGRNELQLFHLWRMQPMIYLYRGQHVLVRFESMWGWLAHAPPGGGL